MGSRYICKDGGMSNDEKKAVTLAGKLSNFILKLIKQSGKTQTEVAEAIGYTRSAFNQLLHAHTGNRVWRLPTVCAVARVLDVPVEFLISAAFAAEPPSALFLAVARTPPHTMDHLERIEQAVAPEGSDEGALNYFFTAQMFRIVAPEYVNQYIDGELTDQEVYDLLETAQREAPPEGNLWGEVKARLNPNGDGPYSPAPQSK